MITNKYPCGVPGLEDFIGRKVNQNTLRIARGQFSFSRTIMRQVTVYFMPDGTITNFSGKADDLNGIINALEGMTEKEG